MGKGILHTLVQNYYNSLRLKLGDPPRSLVGSLGVNSTPLMVLLRSVVRTTCHVRKAPQMEMRQPAAHMVLLSLLCEAQLRIRSGMRTLTSVREDGGKEGRRSSTLPISFRRVRPTFCERGG